MLLITCLPLDSPSAKLEIRIIAAANEIDRLVRHWQWHKVAVTPSTNDGRERRRGACKRSTMAYEIKLLTR